MEHEQLLLSDQRGLHQDALGIRCLHFSPTRHPSLTPPSLFPAALLYPVASPPPPGCCEHTAASAGSSRRPALCPSTQPCITRSSPPLSLLTHLCSLPGPLARLHSSSGCGLPCTPSPSVPPSTLPWGPLWSCFLGSPQQKP